MTDLKKFKNLYDGFGIDYTIEKFTKGGNIHDYVINDEIIVNISPVNQQENQKIYGYGGFYTVLIFSKSGKFVKQMILI